MADDLLFTGIHEEDQSAPTRDEILLHIMSTMNVSQEAVSNAIEVVGLDKVKVEEYLRKKG